MTFIAHAIEWRVFEVLKASVVPGTEVFHQLAPDNFAPPYVVINRIGTSFDPTLTGQSQFVVGLVQIDCWADTDMRAFNVSSKVRLALQGLREGSAVNRIAGCFCQSEYGTFDEENKLYRRTLTFKVMILEDQTL